MKRRPLMELMPDEFVEITRARETKQKQEPQGYIDISEDQIKEMPIKFIGQAALYNKLREILVINCSPNLGRNPHFGEWKSC